MAMTRARDAMNAQGESPPVKRWPAQKKRLREGYIWNTRFLGDEGMADKGGKDVGGSDMKMLLGEGEEEGGLLEGT